jgi:hypothetical protein
VRCSECGQTRNLTPEGVCEWRAGCEHRVRIREGRERRVIAEAEQVILGAEIREGTDVGFYLRNLGFRLPEEDQ